MDYLYVCDKRCCIHLLRNVKRQCEQLQSDTLTEKDLQAMLEEMNQ